MIIITRIISPLCFSRSFKVTRGILVLMELSSHVSSYSEQY